MQNIFPLLPSIPLENIPVQNWDAPEFEANQLAVKVWRLDLIHPWIQGNKWFKLFPFLRNCVAENKEGFVSMGGPFSNHLIALAFAGQALKKRCTFFIRGGEQEWMGNPAIEKMLEWGAEILPMGRKAFKDFHLGFENEVLSHYQNHTWVPMGGSSPDVFSDLMALAEWISEHIPFDSMVLPAATAGTAAGLALGLPQNKKLWVVEVLKSQGGLEKDFIHWLKGHQIKPNWISEYHFGGYARSNAELKSFCQRINGHKAFQIEPIYSGKCFWAVSDLAKKGKFEAGNQILVLHTGGIFPWNLAQLD